MVAPVDEGDGGRGSVRGDGKDAEEGVALKDGDVGVEGLDVDENEESYGCPRGQSDDGPGVELENVGEWSDAVEELEDGGKLR